MVLNKLFGVLLISTCIFYLGCSNVVVPTFRQNEKPIPPTVTSQEARATFDKLSQGLVTYYDDMEDAMYCRCNNDLDNTLIFLPYVIINNHFEPILKLQTFNVGRHPTLFFDKLYIKSTNSTAVFQLKPIKVRSYDDIMDNEIYEFLKEAIIGEYVKIRISGDGIIERELTAEEIAEIDAVFSIYEYFSNVKVKYIGVDQ